MEVLELVEQKEEPVEVDAKVLFAVQNLVDPSGNHIVVVSSSHYDPLEIEH